MSRTQFISFVPKYLSYLLQFLMQVWNTAEKCRDLHVWVLTNACTPLTHTSIKIEIISITPESSHVPFPNLLLLSRGIYCSDFFTLEGVFSLFLMRLCVSVYLFYCWVLFHCVNIFNYPFFCWWNFDWILFRVILTKAMVIILI